MTNTHSVIDIGTNSARLMFAHFEDGRVVCDKKLLRTVRTGEGVNASGKLCEAAIERTICALTEYKEIIAKTAPGSPVFCFATSAVRDASNSAEFIARAHDAAGFDVRILSGDQEARCGFAGAVGGGSGGIIDIGGGSTEIIFGHDGSIVYKKSFQTGCVRALERFAGDEGACLAWAREMFSEIDFSRAGDIPFYAVGGTATALAAMAQKLPEYDPRRITGYILDRTEMASMFAHIQTLEFSERIKLAGLHPKRADVIGYGLAILMAFFEVSGCASVIASDADNLEGALILWDKL